MSRLQEGTYEITYKAKDDAGNLRIQKANVHVVKQRATNGTSGAGGGWDTSHHNDVYKMARDILKQIKPRLTPHFFRHNYVTLLYESGVDPLIAMKIVGHTDYQTTANIYTHVRDEMLKKATVNMNEVFQKRTEE